MRTSLAFVLIRRPELRVVRIEAPAAVEQVTEDPAGATGNEGATDPARLRMRPVVFAVEAMASEVLAKVFLVLGHTARRPEIDNAMFRAILDDRPVALPADRPGFVTLGEGVIPDGLLDRVPHGWQ